MSDRFDHLEAARTLATIEIPDDAYQPLPLAARFATAHALIDIAESLRTLVGDQGLGLRHDPVRGHVLIVGEDEDDAGRSGDGRCWREHAQRQCCRRATNHPVQACQTEFSWA